VVGSMLQEVGMRCVYQQKKSRRICNKNEDNNQAATRSLLLLPLVGIGRGNC
jgi:hypothetical protein